MRSGLAETDISIIKVDIDLDACLDLFDLQTFRELQKAYPKFVERENAAGVSWIQGELLVAGGIASFAGLRPAGPTY